MSVVFGASVRGYQTLKIPRHLLFLRFRSNIAVNPEYELNTEENLHNTRFNEEVPRIGRRGKRIAALLEELDSGRNGAKEKGNCQIRGTEALYLR